MKVPYDELDPYEQELCSSPDSADHQALLFRLLLKKNGVDPDGNRWIGGKRFCVGPSVVQVEKEET